MKKVLLAALVLFLGFWMFTDTRGFVDFLQAAGSAAWSLTSTLFTKLIDVFDQF